LFDEPYFQSRVAGWIEVIVGSMFSGKTEELFRRIQRAKYANQKIVLFKPMIDQRYHSYEIVSHDANSLVSLPLEHSRDILKHSMKADVVGIDEAQFFDSEIVEVCTKLANQGKRVIAVGLDMDFQGKPFYPVPELMAVAEFVTKLHAICVCCGSLAQFSYRLVSGDEQVLLGEKEVYEARCRKCFFNPSESE